MNGSVDVLCFADPYSGSSEKLKLTVPVLVKGGVRVEEGSNPKLMIGDITPLEDAKPKLPTPSAHQGPAGKRVCSHDRRVAHDLPASAKARHACSSIWSAKATSRW